MKDVQLSTKAVGILTEGLLISSLSDSDRPAIKYE